MLELNIDIKDYILLGSENTIHNDGEIINTYTLSLNYLKQNRMAYNKCMDLQACKSVVKTEEGEML